jgi:hypothetical protein
MTVAFSFMIALTTQEAMAWCAPLPITFTDTPLPWTCPKIPNEEALPNRFSIPGDAGRRVALCKALLNPLRDDSILIWYHDWSVWPSGQWMPMFDRFRQAFGVVEPLVERPAYLFEPREFDDSLSFFLWAALFLWDCHVISAAQGYSVFLSHNEVGYTKFPLKTATPRQT